MVPQYHVIVNTDLCMLTLLAAYVPDLLRTTCSCPFPEGCLSLLTCLHETLGHWDESVTKLSNVLSCNDTYESSV